MRSGSFLRDFCKLVFVSVFFMVFVNWFGDNGFSSIAEDRDSKKKVICQKVCVKTEKRRDCRPNPIPGLAPICAEYEVCVQWEEVCKEVN